jgi:hypothetical protein
MRFAHRSESRWRQWASLVPPLLVTASLAATAGLTLISCRNYPGGDAMRTLHTLEVCTGRISYI